ncbi:prepilin peptidase [Planosporangium sp. 12N6]|uniref:prepilin peptidase n=1 Tax=Planosporangium spinosum TaxID=3402278 RepID=UPI003CEEAECF
MLRIVLTAAAGAAVGPLLHRCIAGYARPPAAVLVTAAAAAAFGLLAYRLPAGPALAAFCWVAALGVVLGFVDAATHRLPDRLTMAAFAGALPLLGVQALHGDRLAAFGTAVLSGLALSGFYATLVLMNPAGMGPGDAKLALSLGTVLGWLGGPVVLLGALAGLVLAAGYALVLLTARRISRDERLAHGPFMLVGALLAVVLTG